jgi:DNA invertase Pin-like site-specific DNA recombinase
VSRRRLTKAKWEKLRQAFAYGHSLGSIAEATSISRGTLSAYASRHGWWHDRPDDVEILRKPLERKNDDD